MIIEKLLLSLLFIALVAESLPAAGEVVALREQRGRRVMYAPVVRFTTQLGQTVEFTDEVSSSRPRYRVGKRVRVLYDRHDPSDARVAPTYKLYVSEIIFAAVGAFFAAVGCALVFAFG